ncbi:MAG: cupin domain-containing protein [Deltaproteobacteria bacterium]|nr:cupin domain-containing protein [Deltaproteobacteria bacterium]
MRTPPAVLVLASSLSLLAGCAAPQIGVMHFAEGQVQHAIHAGDIAWKPCPPGLPEGCGMAVLEGDPRGEGLFTARFRGDGSNTAVVPAHWHPKDERVTILEGKAYVAFGEGATREDATEFGPGDYYVNKRHAIHTVWIDGDCVLQITGLGPWKAVPISQQAPPTP